MPITATQALRMNGLKRGRYSDGRNLYLNVSATGSKSWMFIWKPAGEKWPANLGLGAADLVDIEDARIAAALIHKQLRDGIDPRIARKAAKPAVVEKNNTTFGQLVERYVASERINWKVRNGKCKRADDYAAEFERYCPTLLARRVVDITKADIIDVIQPLWVRINPTAKELLNRIRSILDIAVADENIPVEFNVARWGKDKPVLGSAPKRRIKSHASLPHAEAADVIRRLSTEFVDVKRAQMAAPALIFLMLTGVRTDAVVHARWSDIDLDAKLWTIPEEHNKSDNGVAENGALEVPLSAQALILLQGLKRDGSDWVFPGMKKGSPLGYSAMKSRLTKPAPVGLGLAGRASVHGMRATFKTWTMDNGFDRVAAELSLGHKKPRDVSDVEWRYMRGQMIERRSVLMTKWADYIMPRLQLAVAA